MSIVMINPIVSFIVPAFNAGKTLSATLTSIVSQESKIAYEVIIVLSPSEDETLDIAHKFQTQNLNIRIVRSAVKLLPNEARLAGLKEAKAPFIAFVDADDMIAANFLKVLHPLIYETKADIAVGSFAIFKDERVVPYPFRKKGIFGQEKAISLLLSDISFRSFLWGKLFRKKLFEDNAWIFETKFELFEDLPTMVSLLLKSQKVIFTRKTLYYYRKGLNSLTSENRNSRESIHLGVYWFLKYLFLSTNNRQYLKLLSKHRSRIYLSLKYDRRLDKTRDKNEKKELNSYRKDLYKENSKIPQRYKNLIDKILEKKEG